MNAMRAAFEKLAEKDPDIKDLLAQADKHAEVKRVREKQERAKKEAERKKAKAEENRSKDIYVWRTKAHGMNYTMRTGFVFANSLEEAEEIVKKTFATDIITFIDKADISDQLIETGLYIE